ncbi:MAG: hypothetical protein L0I80_08060, partial [Brevibacterium sp.]|nr:hypothetical protein [Brevibacterium sp.]
LCSAGMSKTLTTGLVLIVAGLIAGILSGVLLANLGLQADESPAGGDSISGWWNGWWQAGRSLLILLAGIIVTCRAETMTPTSEVA